MLTRTHGIHVHIESDRRRLGVCPETILINAVEVMFRYLDSILIPESGIGRELVVSDIDTDSLRIVGIGTDIWISRIDY